MALTQVPSEAIADGSVGTSKLADGAATTEKMADGAVTTGAITLVNISGNTWIESHAGMLNTSAAIMGGGSVALSGAPDRIRVATANGSDTLDAGSVNIIYE